MMRLAGLCVRARPCQRCARQACLPTDAVRGGDAGRGSDNSKADEQTAMMMVRQMVMARRAVKVIATRLCAASRLVKHGHADRLCANDVVAYVIVKEKPGG